MERRFRVFRRQAKEKKVYYARLLDERGRVLQTISTGKSNKYAAIAWVENYLKSTEKNLDITIGEFTIGFWHPSGEYVQGRKARGFTISRKHLETCEALTRKYILPTWSTYQINQVTTTALDKWLLDLHRTGALAPSSVNKLLQAVRAIFDHAVFLGYITDNPAAHVRPIRVTFKRRGILTNDEVKRLLSPDNFIDFRHYTINLLAFSTGARLSEIRALYVENIKPDRVEIFHSWEDNVGRKPPKFNSERIVPISPKVYNAVKKVIEDTFPETVIFYANQERKDIPMTKNCIQDNLYKAMRKIGITPDERQARNITFHSWRHKLNSLLRSQGIPDAKIRILTGHRSLSMTDRYTHFVASDFSDVLGAQEFLGGKQ